MAVAALLAGRELYFYPDHTWNYLVYNDKTGGAALAFINWALTPAAQSLAAERGQSYQIPSNSKTAVPRTAPRFQDFKVIKYDFLKFGNQSIRDGLVKKWTDQVFPLPK